jgi:hypothetical protein
MRYHHLLLAFTLVKLVWGMASEARRDIVSSVLDEVRLE